MWKVQWPHCNQYVNTRDGILLPEVNKAGLCRPFVVRCSNGMGERFKGYVSLEEMLMFRCSRMAPMVFAMGPTGKSFTSVIHL